MHAMDCAGRRHILRGGGDRGVRWRRADRKPGTSWISHPGKPELAGDLAEYYRAW
jgi:hypothetical protein